MTGATTTMITPIQHSSLCNHSRSSCMIDTNFHNWQHADSPRKKLFISEEYSTSSVGDDTTVLLECELSSDILSSSQSSNLKTSFNVKDVVCRDPPHDLSLSHSQQFSSFTIDDDPCLELKNTGESSADDLHDIGTAYENEGNYTRSLEVFKIALAQKEELLGKSHPCVAFTMHKIGVVHWKCGSYDDALMTLNQAMQIYNQCLSKITTSSQHEVAYAHNSQVRQDHVVELTSILNSIGTVHLSRGDYELAMKFHQESLATRISNLGPKHPDVARALVFVGMVHDECGQCNKAKKNFLEGLRVQRAVLGNDHVDVAATFNSLGVVCEKKGDYSKAMKAYSVALQIYRSCLGSRHVDVAVTLNNIGQVHSHCNEYQDAMTAFQEALSIMKAVLGKNHRNISATMHNIGLVHASLNDHDHALKIYRDVLQAQRQSLGDDHADIATSLDSMGGVYEKKGKHKKALRFYSKALRVRRAAWGEGHLFVAITLARIGTFHKEVDGDNTKALRRFIEALKLYRAQSFKDDNPRVTKILQDIQLVKALISSDKQHQQQNP